MVGEESRLLIDFFFLKKTTYHWNIKVQRKVGGNFLAPIVFVDFHMFVASPTSWWHDAQWSSCTRTINLASFAVARHHSGGQRDVCGSRWSAAALRLTSQSVQLVDWSGCCVGESWARSFSFWVYIITWPPSISKGLTVVSKPAALLDQPILSSSWHL